MEREIVVNFVTNTLDYFYPPSRWRFFGTNPNRVRAEKIYDTLSSTAKVLSAVVSTVEQLKRFYPTSQREQLTEQQRLEYARNDEQDGTNETITVEGESFDVIPKAKPPAAEIPVARPKI